MFFDGLSKYNGELYPDKLPGHLVKIIKSDTQINVKKFTKRTESLIKFPATFKILLK
jgi:hypothetical protein